MRVSLDYKTTSSSSFLISLLINRVFIQVKVCVGNNEPKIASDTVV